MIEDPERSARIIESFVVGSGGSRDTALSGLALQVRTMGTDRYVIGARVKVQGSGHVDSETLKAIVDAIIYGSEAD